MKKTSKQKKKLTPEQKEEQQKKRRDAAFRKRIRNTFSDSGFVYCQTEGKHFSIGLRTVELDYLFVYENIIVICEDNCKKAKDKEHIRKKNESAQEIKSHVPELISWLSSTFPEKKELLEKYRTERLHVYYIYISQAELNLTDEEKKLYSNLIFWEPETLSYFSRVSQCIFYSARYEIFKYLGLSEDDIGFSGSEGGKTVIKAPIIYPQDATGLRNGVRVVS